MYELCEIWGWMTSNVGNQQDEGARAKQVYVVGRDM